MKIYLDHSATTPLCREALDAMIPYFCDKFGNADSVHAFGRDSAYAVDIARRAVAAAIGAESKEIFFTSGGTEADNWAIKGITEANGMPGSRVIVSAIEHAAVLSSAAWLEKEGYDVVYLPVTEKGLVLPETLEAALKEKPAVLVSVMLANNEIGTIQPIEKLAAIAHNHGSLFHTDAVQAIGSIPVDVKKLNVDALSLSAHKFYGPKGTGALYVKNGTKIDKLIAGGHQEKSMRGGTSPVPQIVGMGKAITLAVENLEKNTEKIASLRDYFVKKVKSELPDAIYNGDEKQRLPQNANFIFPFTEGDSLVMALDIAGIACSSGAACSSGSLEPSHVIKAIGFNDADAKRSVRFSFGKDNTKEEVDYVAEKLVELSETLPEAITLVADVEQKKRKV